MRALGVGACRTLLSASAHPDAARNVFEPPDLPTRACGLSEDARLTHVAWSFDAAERARIRAGLELYAAGDKWRIVAREEAGTLRVLFRTSWTHDLAFVLEIEDRGSPTEPSS